MSIMTIKIMTYLSVMVYKGEKIMRNFCYTEAIKYRGYVEIPETEYTEEQVEMKKYIDAMSVLIKEAKCGWEGVRFALMELNGYKDEYMVLVNIGRDIRWIPINGNSKACNFSVLGENIW